MKKIKNIVMITIIFITCTLCLDVNAWYPTNKTAFSMGSTYKEDDPVDTTKDAVNAYNIYDSMGLMANKLVTVPIIETVKGSHTNGIKYLNSGIVFLSGHSSKYSMNFSFNGYDPFEIKKYNTDNSVQIGLGNYVNKNNALIIFAGCETSADHDSITRYAVEEGGARSAIGWNTLVHQLSHPNWLKRFNTKIKDKKTSVADAQKYANSFIYVYSDVKNSYIYGDRNHNPWYYMSGSNSTSSQSKEENIIERDNMFSINVPYNEKDLNKIISSFITENIDNSFNIEDYKIEVNGTDIKYYDYIFYVDGIRTNYGYTIEIENNKITLFNNMQNINVLELKKKILNLKNKLVKKSVVPRSINQVTKEYPKMNIKYNEYITYYDEETDKILNSYSYKVSTKENNQSIISYNEELQ